MPAFENNICRVGKHAGTHINDVPDGYLEWMKKDSEATLAAVTGELDRRKNKVDGSFMMKILKAGHSTLSADPKITPEEKKKLDYAFANLEQAVQDAGKVGEQ